MNNEFLKKAAALMTAATMLGTTAFATVTIKDGGVTYNSTTKQLTVKYDGVDASKQASLLVYDVSNLSDALGSYQDQAATPIVAIDQVAATGEFVATLPDGVEAGDKLVVKVGATSETAPAMEAYTVPAGAAVAYGDVDGKDGISPNDATQVFLRAQGKLTDDAIVSNFGLTVAEFEARADVDGKEGISPNDATQIFLMAQGKLDKFPVGGSTPSIDPTETPGSDVTPTPEVTVPPTDTPAGDTIVNVDKSSLETGVLDPSTPISDGVSVGAPGAGSVAVVEDEDRGNVIMLEDAGDGQASLKFDLAEAEAAVNGIIQYKVGYNFEVADADITADSSILKDLTLLRLSNKAYADTLPVANSDGRMIELVTTVNGSNYQLNVKDYFTADKDGKATSTKLEINLKPNTWYDIVAEVDSNTNIVKVYAMNADGAVVGVGQATLTAPTETPVAVTNASVMTKGGNTATTTLYVDGPEFSIADTSLTLPEVDDLDVPWTYGENDAVISETTLINFSEEGSIYDIKNLETGTANISKTISFGDITVYMDADRDLEWQDNGGTPDAHGTQGNGGMMEYSGRKYPVGEYVTNFNMGIAGAYSSLFEGMMAKTADGGPIYTIKDEDGTVRREVRIRELADLMALDTVFYDKDGNVIDYATIPEQEEKFTGPFEKVIGVKVAGPCWISVVSAPNGGRALMLSTADGTVLNEGLMGDLGAVPETDPATGISWVTAQYTGEEPTEIYISCQAGGLCVNAIDISFD